MSDHFENWDNTRIDQEFAELDFDSVASSVEVPLIETRAKKQLFYRKWLMQQRRQERQQATQEQEIDNAHNTFTGSVKTAWTEGIVVRGPALLSVIAGTLVVGALVEGATILHNRIDRQELKNKDAVQEAISVALTPDILSTYLCPDQVRTQAGRFPAGSPLAKQYNEAAAQEEKLPIVQAVCNQPHSIFIPEFGSRSGAVLTSHGWEYMSDSMLAPDLTGMASDTNTPLPDLPQPYQRQGRG